jgi:hypothetical protein
MAVKEDTLMVFVRSLDVVKGRIPSPDVNKRLKHQLYTRHFADQDTLSPYTTLPPSLPFSSFTTTHPFDSFTIDDQRNLTLQSW